VEELHAEHGDDPADDLDDNNADHNGHAAAIDGGQHLASDDGIDCAIAKLQLNAISIMGV
jgi:hypothetical protein